MKKIQVFRQPNYSQNWRSLANCAKMAPILSETAPTIMSSAAHLLSCIQQAADGLSLSELLNKAPTLPRRSAQRLIAQLLEGGQIRAQGQARARRYFVVQPQAASYAKTITSDAFPSFIPLSSDSQDVLAYINQPLEARKPVGYQRDFLDSYRPNKTWYLPATLRRQLHQMGKTAAVGEAAGTYQPRHPRPLAD